MLSIKLKTIYRELSLAVDGLSFEKPTSHVYNPLNYAWDPVEQYLDMAGKNRKEVIFLGMNPGPWGMAQTGVPFGTVNVTRDWLGIQGTVDKPANEHPKRPILGFDTKREEVSGKRFWGWARDQFGNADDFFEHLFVANYCPLVFMEQSGRNRTPDKLPANERHELYQFCDHALRQVIRTLDPKLVVGIGKFAEDRARAALEDFDIRIGRILHPSPASPAANRGWLPQAEKQLQQLGFKDRGQGKGAERKVPGLL